MAYPEDAELQKATPEQLAALQHAAAPQESAPAPARARLDRILKEHGIQEPNRGDLDDLAIRWREGKPDYAEANLQYVMGRTKDHKPGSLELVVQDLVKTWEMEASHKPYEQWSTVKHGAYSVQANGGRKYENEAAAEVGNYNSLMAGVKKDLYDSDAESFESSHRLFRTAFPEGFPWEVLEVFSGPPKVAFTWRHWAAFSGEYKGHQGSGEMVELTGFGLVTVDDDLKIMDIEVFYEAEKFLEVLEGKRPVEELKTSGAARGAPLLAAAAATGSAGVSKCPVAH